VKTLIKTCSAVVIAVVLTSSALFAQALDQSKVVAGAERAVEKAAKLSPASAPGCAVGVSLRGSPVFERAFGMAEIEHGVPNTAQTIFESGSVAKQFVAAAIVLLSIEGKLGLDDPVRKHITELPDYGAPLTVRHLLNHTGGVRDWGSVIALTGYGRGVRMISQALAIDVITHQRALDFTPGSEYSYSNSGYQLLATIVERVSKQSLSAFTQERFFKPLGMSHSSWRDDYQRLVPGRAQAYEGPLGGPFRLNMPFMNVYGNGGMLTTVGDWLKWNAMLESRSLGAPLVEALEVNGVLNNGRKISYALGLVVTDENGIRKVSHGGSTAGYQTFLSRYPGLNLSIAVLCNGASRNAFAVEQDVFKEIAGPFPAPKPPETLDLKAEDLQKYVGLFREEATHRPVRPVLQNGKLRWGGGELRPLRDGTFLVGSTHVKFKMGANGKPISAEVDDGENTSRLIVEEAWSPTPDELKSFAGTWHSDEADASFTVAIESGQAFLVQRPTTRRALIPLYKDHFNLITGEVIWFTRDAANRIAVMHVGASRMRDMPFERVGVK